MNNRLEIAIGNKKIVAAINDWNDELPKEMCIYIEDENGIVLQDICLVREHYAFNGKTGKFEINSDFIDCLVWGNSDYDDYSNEFCIGVREEEE